MSVYRRDDSKVYSYDFRHRGVRFHGSTGETDRRKAEAFEKNEKARIKAATIDLRKPMTFQAAATLYWQEVGQFHRNHVDTWRSLGWLQTNIGKTRLISDITDATIANLVSIRRGEGVSPATVNRSVIEPLRGILRRAEKVWKVRLGDVPDWRQHALQEPQERIREMTSDEEVRYMAALRDDYRPLVQFALLTGCRMQELLGLKWADIDWRNKAFRVTGKGDKTREIPMTDEVEAVIRFLPRAHEAVFTYAKKRCRDGARGAIMPITIEGLKTVHARTCAKAGIKNFRFHDFRHTAATRLMRESGNIKYVQQLLGHTQIATTSRYSHVTADDLRRAMIATHSATTRDKALDKKLKIKDK